VVVVPPTGAIAQIQPLHGEAHAIADRASEQFGIFLSRLTAYGVKTISVEPDERAPLGCLCADGAVVFADGAFLMRPSDLKRRAEIAALEAALERARVPIVGRIEAPGLLDGGDVMLAVGTLFIALSRPRQAEMGIPNSVHGNALGREQLAAYARTRGLAVVEVVMAAEVKRLRSVAALVDDRTVLYAAGLVDGEAFAGLQTIVAPRGEDYGAGVLPLGNRRVLANLRFRETIPLLRKAKITVDAIDLWEFGKIGATPSSMALALKRD
jgi:dimethylargininase